MRGLAETRPLEEFPVSLLKIEQRSSPKLDVPLLERIAVRRLVRPTVFETSRAPRPPQRDGSFRVKQRCFRKVESGELLDRHAKHRVSLGAVL